MSYKRFSYYRVFVDAFHDQRSWSLHVWLRLVWLSHLHVCLSIHCKCLWVSQCIHVHVHVPYNITITRFRPGTKYNLYCICTCSWVRNSLLPSLLTNWHYMYIPHTMVNKIHVTCTHTIHLQPKNLQFVILSNRKHWCKHSLSQPAKYAVWNLGQQMILTQLLH